MGSFCIWFECYTRYSYIVIYKLQQLTLDDGWELGLSDGMELGWDEGCDEGSLLGCSEGDSLGADEGCLGCDDVVFEFINTHVQLRMYKI